MKNITLKKTLAVFLYNHQCEGTEDLSSKSDDDSYINIMVEYLSQGGVCPFKNYDCVNVCGYKCGNDRFDIDCGKDNEDVWRDFILKSEPN